MRNKKAFWKCKVEGQTLTLRSCWCRWYIQSHRNRDSERWSCSSWLTSIPDFWYGNDTWQRGPDLSVWPPVEAMAKNQEAAGWSTRHMTTTVHLQVMIPSDWLIDWLDIWLQRSPKYSWSVSVSLSVPLRRDGGPSRPESYFSQWPATAPRRTHEQGVKAVPPPTLLLPNSCHSASEHWRVVYASRWVAISRPLLLHEFVYHVLEPSMPSCHRHTI